MAAKNSKWPKKYKLLRKNGNNSKTIEQNVMFNSLFEKYFNWAEIEV